MKRNENITTQTIGNTTYYIKATSKASAIHDFSIVIQRLIKKEVERKNSDKDMQA